jgi:hypothetical protein
VYVKERPVYNDYCQLTVTDAILILPFPVVLPVVAGVVVATGIKEGLVQKPAPYAAKGLPVVLYALIMKSVHDVAAFPYTVGA